MAVAALAFGIIAIIFAFIPGLNFVAPLIGVLGIGLGLIARRRLRTAGEPTDMATGGLVTSIIGTVFGLIFYIACVACMGGSSLLFNNMMQQMQQQGIDMQRAEEEMRRSMERAIEKGKELQEEREEQKEQQDRRPDGTSREEKAEPLKPGQV